MTAKDAIRNTMKFCHQVTEAYLSDLSDQDLLVRPLPNANHVAWQLGHLICAEHHMVTALGHRMPELPGGFAEAHGKEASSSNDAGKFRKKAEYVALMEKVRAGSFAALDATPEADFDKPGPESMRSYAPTLGAVFTLLGTHELMHAGQFATIRRKLGKPVVI